VYTVIVSNRAQKDLRKLPKATRDEILSPIQALADDPFPPGRKKLKGKLGDYWRIRVGNYRILYEVEQKTITVYVLRIRDRKQAY